MLKFFLIFISSILITNCTFKKVDKHHGVPFLEKKQKLLVVDESNKNDIKKILGTPSAISKFDSDIWIYIERKLTQSELKNFGRMKVLENNVLVLEIDNQGILKNKSFYDKNDMEDIKIVSTTTSDNFTKKSFIYNFMSSMRQKINDPLGSRAKKRREINQR
jgi:outer membrane protein assembly factor BamE (lipoprotein component of BamABCDE complex)